MNAMKSVDVVRSVAIGLLGRVGRFLWSSSRLKIVAGVCSPFSPFIPAVASMHVDGLKVSEAPSISRKVHSSTSISAKLSATKKLWIVETKVTTTNAKTYTSSS